MSMEAQFGTVDEAWFWTAEALLGRHTGAEKRAAAVARRPCDPDDIVKAIDRLYRKRRLLMDHLTVLTKWGQQGRRPSQDHPSEARDWVLWREALDRLAPELQRRGIVTAP